MKTVLSGSRTHAGPPAQLVRFACLMLALCLVTSAPAEEDLPSWHHGPAKQNILKFVAKVTDRTGPDFVAPAERIAVFDNDGTLWCEQPLYTQFRFGMDRMKVAAARYPRLKNREPFKSALTEDSNGVIKSGVHGLIELTAATHGDMTPDDFDLVVKAWLGTARHPRFQQPYTNCVYQPMRELLAYLRGKGFKTYIVSGGALEFMRPWTEKVYGIPPERVIGSTVKTKLEMRNGSPVIVRLPELELININLGGRRGWTRSGGP